MNNENPKTEFILQTLRNLKEYTQTNYKSNLIGVFGSYARKETNPQDLDILVKFTEDASLFHFVGLANFLEEQLQLKVDIVPINAIREEIKTQILNETIYL